MLTRRRLAERLRQAIAERQIDTPDGRSVRVTASFGVAALPGSGTTQVELTAAADDAATARSGRARTVSHWLMHTRGMRFPCRGAISSLCELFLGSPSRYGCPTNDCSATVRLLEGNGLFTGPRVV